MYAKRKRFNLRGAAVIAALVMLALLAILLYKQELMAISGVTVPSGPPDLRLPLEQRLELQGLRRGAPVFMRIFKEEGLLELWMCPGGSAPARSGAGGYDFSTSHCDGEFKLFAIYPICAMSGTLGPKLSQGDKQAPEGFYAVGLKQFNPHSRFHLSFNIGYPNVYDRAHGRTGDFIMVHGNCVSAGCFAMTDRYIEEIYRLSEAALLGGQPFFRIHIFPFRMGEENMARHAGSGWAEFWQMLKPGYDYFERHKTPPDVIVRNKAYVLSDKNRL